VLLSPAPVQFGAVHLFPGRASVPGGNNRIEFINDDCTEIAPEAGTLVGAPGSKVKEILMPVGPHSKEYGKPRY
jgi:hypothetical protein